MKTLVVIFTQSSANEIVRRHWDWYQKSGCDLLGITTEDGNCYWPGDFSRIIGIEARPIANHYINRFLATLEYCLTQTDYGSFCFVEADSIFLTPVPAITPDTFISKFANVRDGLYRGMKFYHSPWFMDRIMAVKVLRYGRIMLQADLTEFGMVDRWFGLMFDLYEIPVVDTGTATHTACTIIHPEQIEETRKMIAGGAWYVHGIKSKSVLEQVFAL